MQYFKFKYFHERIILLSQVTNLEIKQIAINGNTNEMWSLLGSIYFKFLNIKEQSEFELSDTK